jgi:hypothetical protein
MLIGVIIINLYSLTQNEPSRCHDCYIYIGIRHLNDKQNLDGLSLDVII